MKRVIAAAGLSVLALVAAGCSSSSSSTGAATPASSATSSAATSSASAAATSSSSASALGTSAASTSAKPLNIFYFDEEGASAAASSPESFQAAQAAVDYVNDNLGGIKGRPLKLTHCESLGTPDSVINCANQAVDDKADVVIKGVDVAGGSAVPIVTGAGIPYVTLNAGSPDEVDHSLAFSLTSGFAAQFAPVAAYAKSKGYSSLGVIFTNVQPLSTPLDGPFASLLAKEGIKYVPEPVDITSADVTPAYSALLAKHVGGILVVTTLAQCTAALQSRVSLADSTPLFMSSSCDVPSALSAVSPSATNGSIFAFLDTSAVPNDADTKTYLEAMKAYAPSANIGSFAPSGFESIIDFYRAMQTASDPSTLDATSVAATLKSAKNVPLFMGGGQTFSCGQTFFTGESSVCTGAAFLATYSGGSFTLAGAYNAAQLLKGL
jgi:branched-chain amino acid transport system substrate-binding protein